MVPLEVRRVSTERLPKKMFLSIGKIESRAAALLKDAYNGGALHDEIADIHCDHLQYINSICKAGKIWEAGPSADFTDILYIFETDTIKEAKDLLHEDPFYKHKIYYDDDTWFEWVIHAPFSRCQPEHKPQIVKRLREAGIWPTYKGFEPEILEIPYNPPIPKHLYVAVSTVSRSFAKLMLQAFKTNTVPPEIFSIQLDHLWYMLGPGGLDQVGYFWEAGPAKDFSLSILIISSHSMEKAKDLALNDPYAKTGIFDYYRWFEWAIHWPPEKASPLHKDPLLRFLDEYGLRK